MTIDEAIKTLEDILTFVEPDDPPEGPQALQLGTEALRRIKESRLKQWNIFNIVLPGETEE